MIHKLSSSDLKESLQAQGMISDELVDVFDAYLHFFAKKSDKHRWVFNSDLSLHAKIELAITSQKHNSPYFLANHIYWSDMLQSILAAEHIFYFRSEALIASTIEMLTKRDLLSASILSRSLLEVCIWHLYHSVVFANSTKQSLKNTSTNLIDNSELQEMLLKLIWGSKQKNIIQEVKQHNVYKIFDKISKSLKHSDFDLEKNYDLLSELSHPNIEGNNLFIDEDINASNKPLVEVVFNISSKQYDTDKEAISGCCFRTLIWCMRSIMFASEKYQVAEQNIVKTFDLGKTIH